MAKSTPRTPTTLTDSALTEMKELDRRVTDAFSRKDLEAAMACFWNSPDLVVVMWGTILRGTDAVRSAFKQVFDQHESVRLEVDEITHLATGDGVVAVGTATYDLKPWNGPSQKIVERWSDLRRKIDGRWVYVLDHTTITGK